MQTEILDQPLFDPGARDLAPLPAFPTADPAACRQAVLSRAYDRDGVAAALLAWNRAIGSDDAALANIERLRQPQSAVVVTGQQAGMFTGPLYTVFKAATAIRLAREQAAELGQPVIPVFWNATEDHDLSEIASCWFPGREFRAEFPDAGIAAEALPAAPAEALAAQLLEACSDEFAAGLQDLLAGGLPDYGQYSSAVLARLFRGSGLVILEPRLLRPFATAFLTACVRQRDGIRDALARGAAALAAIDLPVSFAADDGFGLFHIDAAGKRGQVLEAAGRFRVGPDELSEKDLLDRIAGAPDRFSTGAYLRPVLQQQVLPCMSFIAGPGEFRYHLQLQPLFELFAAVMPAIRQRNQATILGPAEVRTAAKLGLETTDYFKAPAELYHPADLPAAAAAGIDRARDLLHQSAAALAAGAGDLVGDRAVTAYRKKASKELDKVVSRAERECKRAGEVDNGRVDRFLQAVRPGGPQERRINIFYFLQYAGPGLIGELVETFDPNESGHYILRLE